MLKFTVNTLVAFLQFFSPFQLKNKEEAASGLEEELAAARQRQATAQAASVAAREEIKRIADQASQTETSLKEQEAAKR